MAPSILMSAVGTLIAAGLVGVFCILVFGIGWILGMLIVSVVASTDAASVFAILRSRKLNLKGGLAPILEIESGSSVIKGTLTSPAGTGLWESYSFYLSKRPA